MGYSYRHHWLLRCRHHVVNLSHAVIVLLLDGLKLVDGWSVLLRQLFWL